MIRIFITESTLLKRDFIPRWLSSDKGIEIVPRITKAFVGIPGKDVYIPSNDFPRLNKFAKRSVIIHLRVYVIQPRIFQQFCENRSMFELLITSSK